jgi:hypothetical protein
VIIDTQSVRVAAGVPEKTTGLDASKKTPGRKRGLAVDVMGLLIGVVVLAASAHDNEAGIALLDQAAERCGMRLEKALVDQGFKDAVIIHGAVKDITVEAVRRNPDDRGKGFVPQPKRWIVEQANGALMLHRRLPGPRLRPPARQRGLPRLLGLHRRHAPPPCHPHPRLAQRGGAGRVNVSELLRLLQAEHDETTARADHLREQIEQLTTALAETGARLAELTATRKVIDGLTPPEQAPTTAEAGTVYQRLVTAFNEHPGQVFRVRDLHEHLGLPADGPSINVTRSRLGRLVRQGLLEQPGRGRYQKRT